MEISDTDILSMDECELDYTVLNAPRLNIRSQGMCMHSIRVKSIYNGTVLMRQILKYREELDEVKKISE